MSQQNVEIVRRHLDAYSRRDLKLLRALSDPDPEIDWSSSQGVLAGVYRGLDEAMRFYTDWFETFQMTVAEPDSFADVGESVVVTNVARQRGRDGIEGRRETPSSLEFAGGRSGESASTWTRSRPLKAVGLAE